MYKVGFQENSFLNIDAKQNTLLPQDINIPIGVKVFEAAHSDLKPLNDEQVESILKNNELSKLLEKDPLLIINDHHRSTPSYRILKALVNNYPHVKLSNIILATGSHSAPTAQEVHRLTQGYQKKLAHNLLIHDSKGEMTYIGETSRKTNVKVNPILSDCETILCINSVEPHYFAGFTGGIKSIIPGLASYETIERNHSWAMDDATGPTITEGNPLFEDLWEAGNMLSASFYGIQMVNFQNDIFGVFFDNLRSAFEEARDLSLDMYSVETGELFDVVISVIYPPLDQTLYQAQKGIENTRQILKEGGKLVLVANCQQGLGNDAFFNTLTNFATPEEVLSSLAQDRYKYGDHKAYKFASLASKNSLYLVSELSDNILRQIFSNHLDTQQLEAFIFDNYSQGRTVAIGLDTGSLVLKP